MSAKTRPGELSGGFSLVEVTLAIGIFAFVAIGILGLMPAALKLRSESAQETRAVMIVEELFASVAASGSLDAVVVRDGPAGEPRNNSTVDLTSEEVMIGYPSQTTVPYGMWYSARGSNPREVWETGELPGWAVDLGVETLALLYATEIEDGDGQPVDGLYQLVCEVRSPASLPLSRSRPAVFSVYVMHQ